ncbi:MAG: malate dehydrogenase, partial [Actinomycetia bacterium]|nr:malate dehydrogenase [Actinomycetes bacterium]
LAASGVLAQYARARGLDHGLLPTMAEWEVVPEIAAATARVAHEQGLARLSLPYDELVPMARRIISEARRATATLMHEQLIPDRPTLD